MTQELQPPVNQRHSLKRKADSVTGLFIMAVYFLCVDSSSQPRRAAAPHVACAHWDGPSLSLCGRYMLLVKSMFSVFDCSKNEDGV
jgi:hypothetical protein